MDFQLISIRIQSVSDPRQQAWLSVQVTAREDQHLHFQADVIAAMARDPISFMHPLTDAQAKVVKADIVGGILLARKSMGKRGFVVELQSLGGSTGEDRSILQVPSVAFGIAAQLAVIHGLGIEDLIANPRGGYGWTLSELSVQAGKRVDEGQQR